MAGALGRECTFTWGGTTILGVREKGVTVNGEPVDITTGEDSGWRTLYATPGEKSVELKISGLIKSKAWKTDFFAVNLQKAVVLTYLDGGVIAGTFHLVSVDDGHPYKDAASFDVTLQSTGIITYTP